MSALARLQRWYAARCNGAWEHQHGVSIVSCDNPGWWVKVALAGTPLDGVPFAEVADGVWHGAGDAQKLAVILESLRFVPVDFEAGDAWWDVLVAAGFDATRPAVVASTGVSMYFACGA